MIRPQSWSAGALGGSDPGGHTLPARLLARLLVTALILPPLNSGAAGTQFSDLGPLFAQSRGISFGPVVFNSTQTLMDSRVMSLA